MRKLVVVILTVVSSNLTFSQMFNGKITYQATIIVNDILQKNSTFIRSEYDVVMPEGFKDLEIKSGKDAIPTNFILFFNENESLYQSEYNFEETKKLGLLMNQTNLVGRQSRIYYTNTETNQKIFQSWWTSYILVKTDNIEWELTEETKQIGKYTANKAIAMVNSEEPGGRTYLGPVEAWYTSKVPLPYGIQNFIGLPGLTLELTANYLEGKIRYLATSIQLDSDEVIDIEKPEGTQLLSEKEYFKLIDDLNKKR